MVGDTERKNVPKKIVRIYEYYSYHLFLTDNNEYLWNLKRGFDHVCLIRTLLYLQWKIHFFSPNRRSKLWRFVNIAANFHFIQKWKSSWILCLIRRWTDWVRSTVLDALLWLSGHENWWMDIEEVQLQPTFCSCQ